MKIHKNLYLVHSRIFLIIYIQIKILKICPNYQMNLTIQTISNKIIIIISFNIQFYMTKNNSY